MREKYDYLNDIINTSEEEVVLISFEEKNPQPIYELSSSAARSSGQGEMVTHYNKYRVTQNNNDNSNISQQQIRQQTRQQQKDYDSILLSYNYILVSSMMVFLMVLFLPKTLRRRISAIGRRIPVRCGIGQSNCAGRGCHTSGNTFTFRKSSGAATRGNRPMLNNQRVDYYQSKKEEYTNLFPNGDACLADEESTVETNDVESNNGFKRTGPFNNTNSATVVKTKNDEKMNRVSPQSRLLSSRRTNYGSTLPALDTNFVSTCSIQKAKPSDNEELSPLECIQNGESLQTVFRGKDNHLMRMKPIKEGKEGIQTRKLVEEGSVNHNTNPTNPKPQPQQSKPQSRPNPQSQQLSGYDRKLIVTPSSSTTSDIFSIHSDLYSPPLSSILDDDEEENNPESKTIKENNILVERKLNINVINTNSSRRDSKANNTALLVKTPQSIKTSNTDHSRTSTNFDFTPSPMSIFSKDYERSEAVVILISSELIFAEQYDQQQKALKELSSNKLQLPVKVVDGNEENNRKRREELFRISGIRGQYPQIFFMDDKKRLKYCGNQIAMDKLCAMCSGNGSLVQSNRTQLQLPPRTGNTNGDGVIDASFFSI